MKINFGDYTYFGDENKQYNNRNQYKFDENYFNNLVSNRQYEQAANYASNYHFNDPRIDRQHKNDIINLERYGRILGAVYGRIHDSKQMAHVEFSDKVFVDGGIEQLANSTNKATKEYADNFIKAKRSIGSVMDYNTIGENTIKEEATSLAVTFKPEKRTFLGIDWLAKDNSNNIDNFYEVSGLTRKQLEQNNVNIINKDGKTTLVFGKDNPLANQILFNLPNSVRNRIGDIPAIDFGGDENVTITGFDNKGKQLVTNFDVRGFKKYIEDANETKDKVFQQLNIDKKGFSSSVGPALSDEVEYLNNMYNTGEIDSSTYNREYKKVAGWMDEVLLGIGSGNYQFFTNANNDSPTDETLVEADNEERGELMNLIPSVAKNRIHLLSMTSNGQIGTLIVIDGLKNEKDENDDVTSGYKSRRRLVFVPGLFKEAAQAKINQDSSIRAIQEYNDMMAWGYDYKFVNGNKISVDESGHVWSNGKEIDKEYAIRQIDKDILKRQASNELKYQYLNDNDELMDFNGYEKQARNVAVKIANNIMPNIPLIGKDNSPLSVEDIFSYKGSPDDDELVGKKAVSKLQYEVYDKISEIFDIYNYIMQGTSYYKY